MSLVGPIISDDGSDEDRSLDLERQSSSSLREGSSVGDSAIAISSGIESVCVPDRWVIRTTCMQKLSKTLSQAIVTTLPLERSRGQGKRWSTYYQFKSCMLMNAEDELRSFGVFGQHTEIYCSRVLKECTRYQQPSVLMHHLLLAAAPLYLVKLGHNVEVAMCIV